MNRNFRLRQSTEFMRVRRFGKSYAHPLVVLVALPVSERIIHIGVSAGRSVGNATQRNKAKRMLREAIRPLIPEIDKGFNIILIARNPLKNASLVEIRDALQQLLKKAKLITNDNGTSSPT